MTDTHSSISSTIEQPADPMAVQAPTQPKRKELNYLRDRPFLVVNTIRRPVKSGITRRKGWTDHEGNWKIFETPFIVDRVKPNMLREATVIIDVTRSTCIKNRFDRFSDTEAVHHFMNKYGEYVKQAMGVWLRKMAQKMASDPRFAERLAEKATEQALAESVTPPVAIDADEVVADQAPVAANEG